MFYQNKKNLLKNHQYLEKLRNAIHGNFEKTVCRIVPVFYNVMTKIRTLESLIYWSERLCDYQRCCLALEFPIFFNNIHDPAVTLESLE